MKPAWCWLLAVALLSGCWESDVGRRYRGERDLFWADREFAKFVRDPSRARDEAWMRLADRYESIAREHLSVAIDPRRPATLEIREISALALFRAAQVHAALHDSLWVERIFTEMADTFESAPGISGEVWLARGRAAENRGEWAEAIRCFELVVRDYAPRPNAPGVEGIVLDLPLRVARARAQLDSLGGSRTAFDAAASYYREHAAHGQPDATRAAAWLRLGWSLGEGGDWAAAARTFDELEEWLMQFRRRPPLEAASTGLEAILAHRRAGDSLPSLTGRVEELLATHRRGEATLLACIHLSRWYAERDDLVTALAWVDRCLADAPETTIRADALLLRAQLLDRLRRPVDAYKAYRLVQAEYPISEAALRSHVELATHFARLGDSAGRTEALERAEFELRGFIVRYPRGAHTVIAFEHLVRVLELKQDHEAAVDELLAMGEHVRGTSRESEVLFRAARKCEADLGQIERAASILELVAERYPATRVGVRAAAEARRLRGLD